MKKNSFNQIFQVICVAAMPLGFIAIILSLLICEAVNDGVKYSDDYTCVKVQPKDIQDIKVGDKFRYELTITLNNGDIIKSRDNITNFFKLMNVDNYGRPYQKPYAQVSGTLYQHITLTDVEIITK